MLVDALKTSRSGRVSDVLASLQWNPFQNDLCVFC